MNGYLVLGTGDWVLGTQQQIPHQLSLTKLGLNLPFNVNIPFWVRDLNSLLIKRCFNPVGNI